MQKHPFYKNVGIDQRTGEVYITKKYLPSIEGAYANYHLVVHKDIGLIGRLIVFATYAFIYAYWRFNMISPDQIEYILQQKMSPAGGALSEQYLKPAVLKYQAVMCNEDLVNMRVLIVSNRLRWYRKTDTSFELELKRQIETAYASKGVLLA